LALRPVRYMYVLKKMRMTETIGIVMEQTPINHTLSDYDQVSLFL
jgi:hypothetical protein